MYYVCEVKFALFIACGMSFFLPCSLYLVVCYVHDSSSTYVSQIGVGERTWSRQPNGPKY